MASTGEPPSKADFGGEEYRPVVAGFFGRSNRRLGKYVPPTGFSKSTLLTGLSLLAQFAGKLELAWLLHKKAVEVEPSALDKTIMKFEVVRVTPLAAQFADPQETISLMERCSALMVEIENRNRREVELRYIYLVFCPMFTELISSGKSQEKQLAGLSTWRDVISANRHSFEEPDLWLMVINVFEMLLTNPGPRIEEGLPSFPEMLQLPLRAISELFAITDRRLLLQERYIGQVRTGYYFLDAEERGLGHALYGLGRYLHNFWSQVAEKHGLVLSNPQRLRAELKSLSPNCSGQTVAKILLAVEEAVNMQLPSDISDLLQKHDINRCV